VAAAGDVDGDGYADVAVGAPLFRADQPGEGRAFVHLGNAGRGGWVRTLQQRSRSGARPIALFGLTGEEGSFRIRASFPVVPLTFSWAWPATPRAYLEWEVKPSGTPFDGSGIERSALGVPLVPGTGAVTLEETARLGLGARMQLTENASFHWRARVATDNPLFAHTPWFSQAGNTLSEAKLRRPELRPR
jgi:hypothetical protein